MSAPVYPPRYVILPVAGEPRMLRFGLEQIAELQTTTGAALGALSRRLFAAWYFADLLEIIRLALIGGGMPAIEAVSVVETVAEEPLAAVGDLARSAFLALIRGYDSGKKGVPDGEGWFNYPMALGNCTVIGVSLAEARSLSLWEYEAALTEYSNRQPEGDDAGEPVEPPDAETVRANMERLKNDPRYTN